MSRVDHSGFDRGVFMEDPATTRIEIMSFPTTTPYVADGWRKDDGIEVTSSVTDCVYMIVITALKPYAIEGVITIVNGRRIGREEQRKVTLYEEDGMFAVYSRT